MSMTALVPHLDTRSALFLDFDGTLVDIAPAPDRVVVEPGLVAALGRLAACMGGALGIVSGRPIAEVDRWLSPLVLPVAGIHGAERRAADGRVRRIALGALDEVAAAAERVAARHPGIRVERKGVAVALHYRLAPEHEAQCLAAMADAVARDPGLHLMRGKMVVEVLPNGVSKGHAIDAFLAEPPFAGRRPVFLGDDVTDEHGFAAVQRLGGQAVKIGAGDTVAALRLASPEHVRRWLHDACLVLCKGKNNHVAPA